MDQCWRMATVHIYTSIYMIKVNHVLYMLPNTVWQCSSRSWLFSSHCMRGQFLKTGSVLFAASTDRCSKAKRAGRKEKHSHKQTCSKRCQSRLQCFNYQHRRSFIAERQQTVFRLFDIKERLTDIIPLPGAMHMSCTSRLGLVIAVACSSAFMSYLIGMRMASACAFCTIDIHITEGFLFCSVSLAVV